MGLEKSPNIFARLISNGCIDESDILKTRDGFFVIYKSVSDILFEKNILDFPDSDGVRLSCKNFYDDWFLYAVPCDNEFVYSLLKLREQEFDKENGLLADGDTPGVTVSFISFDCLVLLDCISEPSDVKRKQLNNEINRVVAYKGQNHHQALKKYFIDPRADGPYLTAALYSRHIAGLAENGYLCVPERYKELVWQSASHKFSSKLARIPDFIADLNKKAGRTVCDNEKIYVKDREHPDEYECAAILATHTGNTSVYSFAAEVEYHARFLIPLAKIKIPFFGRSVYASAVRADLTIDDSEFEGPAPFYRDDSRIVKRQHDLHGGIEIKSFFRKGKNEN